MNGKVRDTLPLAITVRWASLFSESGGVVLH